MKREGLVENRIVGSGYWEIPLTTKTIGTGDGSVYLYYFPNDKQIAVQSGILSWKCKIGYTDGLVSERVKDQIKGSSQNPIVPLIIKTYSPQELETHIHEKLFTLGKHVEDTPGTEWFLTNPDEVLKIYKQLQEM